MNFEEIGKRIKKRRQELNMSQRQLSEETGISVQQISEYENAKKNIGLFTIDKIARALELSIDEIIHGPSSRKPIESAKNVGEMIVNCVDALYQERVVIYRYNYNESKNWFPICFFSFGSILSDMVEKLDDLGKNINNYPDPKSFKQQILAAAAKRINDDLIK